jgi:ribosomal protein L37AE/L43A
MSTKKNTCRIAEKIELQKIMENKHKKHICPGCGKPLYARAKSMYGHGEICSHRMFSPINCVLREALEGDFITKEREKRKKQHG